VSACAALLANGTPAPCTGTLRENTQRMATHKKAQTAKAAEQTNGQHHLYELLKEFPTVMLGTFEQTGVTPSLVARPMSVSKLEPDCRLTFITGIDTTKIEEAMKARVGHVIGQSKTRFFSVRGQITISQDRARIRQLWTKASELWFDGPNDPKVVLMDFHPEEAELWDVSGANGLRFVFEAVKAVATGEKLPKESETERHDRFQVNR
jgi:general stress protein 26